MVLEKVAGSACPDLCGGDGLKDDDVRGGVPGWMVMEPIACMARFAFEMWLSRSLACLWAK